MRVSGQQGELTALAVAGSYVVLLGWDMPEQYILAGNILGFAIQRTRKSDGEVIWLSGMKTFASVEPTPAPGVPVSSFKHPFQTFQWSDYSVSPNAEYRYQIVAMRGPAGALTPGDAVQLTVLTEPVDKGEHAIFFNRGAIASQEYARRFHNASPAEIGDAAWKWLSRGLIEGLERFIGQADKGDELHGAIFEFKNSRIYEALKSAAARGATVSVIYDGDSQRESNEKHLAHSGIEALTHPRIHSGRYMHNKFFVFRRQGVSQQVWTGSTNLSENGIFGHSNNAHIVRDPRVAEQYETYWQLLLLDLTRAPTAKKVETITAAPPVPWRDEVSTVFSPRTSLTALEWYAKLAADAQRALFGTFAFGMNKLFVPAWDRTDEVLRFALLEKKGSGSQYKQQAAEIDRIRKHPNVTVAVGQNLVLNAFDRWLKEIESPVEETHVTYIHTKYLLIDPLGPEPIVIVGSANFSAASTDTNDENMLVIKGNAAVADVYLGEFMRLFTHYAFRESVARSQQRIVAGAVSPKYLYETTQWIDAASGYFVAGSDRALRRRYFSGQ